MSADIPIARFFLFGGGALLFVGLVLWWALPISLSLPPDLITALLALAYGFFCRKKSGPLAVPPAAAGKEESRG
jgi:hypothetical protein